MQKEISYIRLKKRLPIKSPKIAPPLFQKIFVKTKKFFLQEVPSNRTPISQTLSPIGRLRFLGWYHLRNYAPYTKCHSQNDIVDYLIHHIQFRIFNSRFVISNCGKAQKNFPLLYLCLYVFHTRFISINIIYPISYYLNRVRYLRHQLGLKGGCAEKQIFRQAKLKLQWSFNITKVFQEVENYPRNLRTKGPEALDLVFFLKPDFQDTCVPCDCCRVASALVSLDIRIAKPQAR